MGRTGSTEPLASLAVEANVRYVAFDRFDKALEFLEQVSLVGESQPQLGFFLGGSLLLVRVKWVKHLSLEC